MNCRVTVLRPHGWTSTLILRGEPDIQLLRLLVGGEPEVIDSLPLLVYANRNAAICELEANHSAARVLGEVPSSIDGLLRGNVVLVELLH